jgi:serine/threonine protein kinase
MTPASGRDGPLPIEQLRDLRRRAVSGSLKQIIGARSHDRNSLLDLACVDLIERRRMGQGATVEDYLRDFPLLGDVHSQLELIDAEICARRELAQVVTLDEWLARFPSLSEPLRRMFALDALEGIQSPLGAVAQRSNEPPAAEAPSAAADSGQPTPAQRMDAGQESSGFGLMGDGSPLSLPVPIPDGYQAQLLAAAREGVWLYRGREVESNHVVAIKIMRLSRVMDATEPSELADRLEHLALLTHPTIIPPLGVVVQQGWVIVLRPWVEGQGWSSRAIVEPIQSQKQLAQLADCIASIHASGQHHGRIHPGNLIVDHAAQIKLVDAGASAPPGDALWYWTMTGDGRQRDASALLLLAIRLMDLQRRRPEDPLATWLRKTWSSGALASPTELANRLRRDLDGNSTAPSKFGKWLSGSVLA